MKTKTKICTAIATALLLAPSVEAGPKKAPVQKPWSQIERSKAAAIRAELMAPMMTRAEAEKVAAVLADRRERADREVAAYEQFRMDQQIALAEASRSQVVINNYIDTPGKDRPAAVVSTMSGGVQQVAYTQATTSELSNRVFVTGAPGQRPPKNYPSRFYRRASQEEGLDKQAAAFNAQALLEALTPLFGQPLPGMSGSVTGPAPRNDGFIDVRGLAPGTQLRDPTTGVRVRVP